MNPTSFPSDEPVSPQHRRLLEAAIAGTLSVDQEQELEMLLERFPSYVDELDRLSHDAGNPTQLPKILNDKKYSSPALAEAMKQWLEQADSRGAKTPNPGSLQSPGAIALESENIFLVRKLGEGGMGVVYEGFDKHLERAVAVKFLSVNTNQDPSARDRLLSEAQAAAQLQHENVVAIYSIHPKGSEPYLVQQYVPGETLQELIDRTGPLDHGFLVHLTRHLARGLSAAHRKGLIHRDLKPDNVLIESDTNIIRIADFGLAKRHGYSRNTLVGTLTGTPCYMSPEQTRGEALDCRSDLFSLGCLLYCAAAGQPPFSGDDPYIVMDQIRSGSPVPISTLRQDLSPVWVAALERLLCKERGDRFESAEQLLSVVEPQKERQSANRVWLWTATVACSALLATSLVFSVMYQRRSSNAHQNFAGVPSEIQFHVDRHPVAFHSLTEAIAHATNDSEIIVRGIGELECESIAIRGKNLRIMAEEKGKIVLRAKPQKLGIREPFVSTDSDLLLSGICLVSSRSSPIELSTSTEEPSVQSILYMQHGKLQLSDCSLTCDGISACVMSLGSEISALNTQFSAVQGFGMIGLQPLLHLRMMNCSLVARDCLELIVTNRVEASADPLIVLEQCSLEGEAAIRFVFGPQPTVPIDVTFSNSVFDCERQIDFSSFLPKRPDLSNEQLMFRHLNKCLKLQIANCLHRQEMDFFGTSSLRKLSKRSNPLVTSWSEWSAQFGIPTEASVGVNLQEPLALADKYRECGYQPEK